MYYGYFYVFYLLRYQFSREYRTVRYCTVTYSRLGKNGIIDTSFHTHKESHEIIRGDSGNNIMVMYGNKIEAYIRHCIILEAITGTSTVPPSLES